jgi:hypothetical protein
MDFFFDIIILPMLNYFQLLYDYFSLFKLFHPTLFTVIFNYFYIIWYLLYLCLLMFLLY